jgi:hypothetical protein
MSWFLRVVEHPAGHWTCRRGLEDFDQHPDLDAALQHIRDLAAELVAARVFVHYADGRVLSAD